MGNLSTYSLFARRPIVLTLFSAFTGWIYGLLAFGVTGFALGESADFLAHAAESAYWLGLFVAIGWIALLLPFSIFTSDRSKLWRPINLVWLGSLAGILMVCLFFIYGSIIEPEFRFRDITLIALLFPTMLAIVVGGGTGLTYSLLRQGSRARTAS